MLSREPGDYPTLNLQKEIEEFMNYRPSKAFYERLTGPRGIGKIKTLGLEEQWKKQVPQELKDRYWERYDSLSTPGG